MAAGESAGERGQPCYAQYAPFHINELENAVYLLRIINYFYYHNYHFQYDVQLYIFLDLDCYTILLLLIDMS
jgi:hypothetical protein